MTRLLLGQGSRSNSSVNQEKTDSRCRVSLDRIEKVIGLGWGKKCSTKFSWARQILVPGWCPNSQRSKQRMEENSRRHGSKCPSRSATCPRTSTGHNLSLGQAKVKSQDRGQPVVVQAGPKAYDENLKNNVNKPGSTTNTLKLFKELIGGYRSLSEINLPRTLLTPAPLYFLLY